MICETVEELAKFRAVASSVNKNSTDLHEAVRKKSPSLVKFLLEIGVKADVRNEEGLTAFELAKELNCDGDIIELFEKHSQSNEFQSRDQFHSASLTNSPPSVKFESFSAEHLWSTLRANSKQPCISIACRFKWDNLLIEKFCKTIELFENLIFVNVLIDDNTSIDDLPVLHYMKFLKNPVIFQFCSSSNAKVYFKEFKRDPDFIDLNDVPMDVDEDFMKHLEDKTSFGIRLILQGFMLNKFGKFSANQPKNLLNFNLVRSGELIDYAVKYNHVLSVRFLLLLYPVQWNVTDYPMQNMSRDMLASLLKVEFPIPTGAIQLSPDVVDQFNQCKNHLIMNAAYAKRQDLVELLVQCTNDKDYKALIECFIRLDNYTIALAIIKADALYPDNFEIYNNVPSRRELDDFCRKRNQLHDLIANVNSTLKNVKEHFSKLGESKLYLNTNNESALATALRKKKFKIYCFLLSRGVTFKDDVEKQLMDQLNSMEKFQISERIIPFMSQIGEASIAYLCSKTQILFHQRSKKREMRISSCYHRLNEIPEMSAIMSVVRYCDYLDITIDFDNESTVEVNPMSRNSEGVYFPGLGRIYIGAKGDESRLLGVIAHELTHLAMELVYSNQCKPHFRAGVEEELEFNKLVEETSRLTNLNPVISNVFNPNCYPDPDSNAAELIVRVNHILAMYGLKIGEAMLKDQVPKLLDYYYSHVMKQCRTFYCESHLIKMKREIKHVNDVSGIITFINNSNIQFKSPVDVQKYFQSDRQRIEMRGDKQSELGSFLDSEQQVFIDKTRNPRLTTIRIYQQLISRFYYYENRIVVLTFDEFLQNYNRNPLLFGSGACKIIVLECTTNYDDVNTEYLRSISNVLSGKKLIVVAPCSDVVDSVTLNDLTVDSTKSLLNCDVRFQWKTIRMNEWIKPNLYDLVDAETIIKLANKEVIVIGKELPVDDEEFYLPRVPRYGARINFELVKKHLEDDQVLADDFAICCQNDTVEIVNLDGANEENFLKLCKKRPKANIHWLKRKTDHYIYKKSKSTQKGFTKLKGFVEKLNDDLSEASFVEQMDEHQLVIISDVAGMGKTTLFTHIALRLKDKYPCCWVLKFNLNLCTGVLEEEAKNASFKAGEVDKAIDFFVDKLLWSQVETEFEKKLIRQSFETDDSIIILLDAFDELNNEHQKVIMKLVKEFKKTKVKQIWITTRPYLKLRLERQLLQLSHAFVPFNQKAQLNFLTEFWMRNLKVEIDCRKKVNDFAVLLLKKFSKSIGDKVNLKFTGIPLQLRLLAEAFEASCDTFYKSGDKKPSLPDDLDVTNPFGYVIKRKFEMFYYDKSGLEPWTKQGASIKKKLYSEFIENHRVSALFTFFDKRDRGILLSNSAKVDNSLKKIVESLFDYGIIKNIPNGQPQFVHRAFAEYFTAELIVDHLSSNKIDVKFIDTVLTNVLIVDKLTGVRSFINMFLSDKKDSGSNFIQPVKSSVINSELDPWNSLRVATEEVNSNIFLFVLNSLKRADCCDVKCVKAADVFFTAVKSPRFNEVACKLLLENKFNVNIVSIDDSGHCRTALCEAVSTAVSNGNADAFEWLFNNGADCNIRLGQKHNYCPFGRKWYYKWDGCTAFHVVCMYSEIDCIDMVSTLLASGADVNSTDEYRMTPLHVAAICGHSKIVDTLIKNKNKAHVNAVNVAGYTPLCEAIRWQRKGIVEYLVKLKEVDVNATNGSGVTPLHVAAVYGNGEIVQILLDHGANVNALVVLGETPTADVSSWHMTEFIKKTCLSDVTPLCLARVSGNEDIATVLIKIEADDVNAVPLPQLYNNLFPDRIIIQNLKKRPKR